MRLKYSIFSTLIYSWCHSDSWPVDTILVATHMYKHNSTFMFVSCISQINRNNLLSSYNITCMYVISGMIICYFTECLLWISESWPDIFGCILQVINVKLAILERLMRLVHYYSNPGKSFVFVHISVSKIESLYLSYHTKFAFFKSYRNK